MTPPTNRSDRAAALHKARARATAIPADPSWPLRLAEDLRHIRADYYVLTQLADEQAGPLATVRGLVEHSAYRIARQPGAAGTDTADRLELIARRLHAIQQDLDTTAAHLAQPGVAAPAAPRRTAHRSL